MSELPWGIAMERILKDFRDGKRSKQLTINEIQAHPMIPLEIKIKHIQHVSKGETYE